MIALCLVVGFLAVARITRLLVEDKIMLFYRQWIVKKWGTESTISYWAHCPWCTSVWVALLVMPLTVIFASTWVLAALAVPAASLIAGLTLDRE